MASRRTGGRCWRVETSNRQPRVSSRCVAVNCAARFGRFPGNRKAAITASVLALLLVCWASPLLAQTPTACLGPSSVTFTATEGQSASFTACHEGEDTTGYHLWSDDQVVATASSSALQGGNVTLTGTFHAGPHVVRISAFNDRYEAGQPAGLGLPSQPPSGCPDYTSPAGVLTPHAVGDVLVGWNQFNLTTVEGMNRYTARIQQLATWGVSVVIDQPPQYIAGLQYVHLVGTCVGVTP